MPALPTETLQACRYMTKAQVDNYNALAEMLGKARTFLSQADEIRLLEGRLESVRSLMQLDRIRIGFLGPSQVGKSFTVANLLGVSKTDSPAPQGGLALACTSAPTRIRVLPPRNNFEGSPDHEVRLLFMTRAEFRSRVEAILNSPLLQSLNLSYTEPLRDLLTNLEGATTQTLAPGGQDTLRHLTRLIRSGIQYGERLANQEADRSTQRGVFAERTKYVTDNYDPNDPNAALTQTNEFLLLREAQIDFRLPVTATKIDGEYFPADLELLDLPGLGTMRAADDEVTKQFLPELQGAFVFQHSIQLQDSAVGILLNLLHGQYDGALGGRIWYVVTKMDSLVVGATENPANNILQSIENRRRVYRLQKAENVVLIGNENYQDVLRNGRISRNPSGFTDCGWERDSQGVPVPITSMRQPEDMAKLYREVLIDGGIPRFLRIINQEVIQSVAAEIRSKVDAELCAIARRISTCVEASAARAGMPLEAIINCAKWEAEFTRIRQSLVGGDFQFVETPAIELQRQLKNLVDDMLEGVTIQPHHMKERHAKLARLLRHTAIEKTVQPQAAGGQSLIASALKSIRDRVMQVTIPAINVGPMPDPRNSFVESLDGCLAESAIWVDKVFAEFESPYPGIDEMGQTHIYQKVMKAKVGAVSRAFAMRILAEINGCLLEVEGRLRALAGGSQQVNASNKAALDSLLQESRQLKQRICLAQG